MLLGPATVGFLRDAGQEVTFAADEVIVRRGEQQDFFHVVIEGKVELFLNEGESRKRPLARLGEGGIFGAESVLGKEGAAIDAVAVTDVRLLRYPASALPTALQESASLRQKLLGGFARNLHKTTSDALDLMHGADVIARLVQGDSDPDELIAASPRMKAIRKKIPSYGERRTPMLIAGEDGTGKTQIARLIHDASHRITRPADRGQLPRSDAGPRRRADPRAKTSAAVSPAATTAAAAFSSPTAAPSCCAVRTPSSRLSSRCWPLSLTTRNTHRRDRFPTPASF